MKKKVQGDCDCNLIYKIRLANTSVNNKFKSPPPPPYRVRQIALLFRILVKARNYLDQNRTRIFMNLVNPYFRSQLQNCNPATFHFLIWNWRQMTDDRWQMTDAAAQNRINPNLTGVGRGGSSLNLPGP